MPMNEVTYFLNDKKDRRVYLNLFHGRPETLQYSWLIVHKEVLGGGVWYKEGSTVINYPLHLLVEDPDNIKDVELLAISIENDIKFSALKELFEK